MTAKKKTNGAPAIKTTKGLNAQIYAYTTPEIARHDGWLKIGYTDQQVDWRVKQQVHTVDVIVEIKWHMRAAWEDGSGIFDDKPFHAYLRKLGYENDRKNEWFHISADEAKLRLIEFRMNKGILAMPDAIPYDLRSEQEAAVKKASDYFSSHPHGEFLWNAKPRFGKTLATYDLMMRIGAKRVLVVTNRPAIANSWLDDYVKFVGTDHGYRFVSSVKGVSGKEHCLSREDYDKLVDDGSDDGIIEFVSLQDLKGALRFGGRYEKLDEVADTDWDLLVIDEAHEGVDTYKTDVAFDHISRKSTLHLSGTPFKAIANAKFQPEAIYDWTYADEQEAKRDWDDANGTNPYIDLPRLNLYTYKMSDAVSKTVSHGADVDGESMSFAFDLNEFFAVDDANRRRFRHDNEVRRFLDALTTQTRFPFSTPELRDELKHTLWILDRVASAKLLAEYIRKTPAFRDGGYKVIVAAGDGETDEDTRGLASYDKVKAAIKKYDKTITLSVGQLTTGVTIPEWTAVMMLANMKSPALYMQAAFRAQNPCLFKMADGEFARKTDAYVFDFDPARTLTIVEQFANDLYSDTADGLGDMDTRKARVRRLLNFYPVYGEDEDGEMVSLDAESVLSIPRRILCREVVRHGFMSDMLFQNVTNVFSAPQFVIETLQTLNPCDRAIDGKVGHTAYGDVDVNGDTAEELSLDENGNVSLADEKVIGISAGVFGKKVYDDLGDQLDGVIDDYRSGRIEFGDDDDVDAEIDRIEAAFESTLTDPLLDVASKRYGDDMTDAHRARVDGKIRSRIKERVARERGDYDIKRNVIENEYEKAVSDAESLEAQQELADKRDKQIAEARNEFSDRLDDIRDDLVRETAETIVRETEEATRNRRKRELEDGIKAHLRGFARTIPAFLMAYGSDGTGGHEATTLANFDKHIPAEVFLDLTSITLEQFRFLRDGGNYVDESGQTQHFDGHLFDEVVFDDSVKEFMRLRRELANYLDESHTEDIYDYIPQQRTNQIFTPRAVIRSMLDSFEKENPGCFDRPDTTFIDPYMKSGMYITEIVKRLYNSESMKRLFPDDKDRLYHIFEYQVFGIAPTQILYNITTNYILGVDEELSQLDGPETNFDCVDTSLLAQTGQLDGYIDERFGSAPTYVVNAA